MQVNDSVIIKPEETPAEKTSAHSFFSSFVTKVRSSKPKVKIISTILGFLVLTVGLVIGVYEVKNKQGTNANAGSAVLSLSSSSNTPNVGDSFVVAIAADTAGQSITAADLRVRFDTNLLEATSITPAGNNLPTVLSPALIDIPDANGGRAMIVVGALVDNTGTTAKPADVHPKTGSNLVLAQVAFRAKATGSATITFGGSSAISAIGQTASIVGTMSPLTITIGGTGTAPPSASPAPTASPVPGATATPVPTATPVTGGTTYYKDADGDGFGNPAVSVQAATQPAGYVVNKTDCYDNNANAKPGSTYCGAASRGDGSFDYNCSGTADKCGSVYGAAGTITLNQFSSARKRCQPAFVGGITAANSIACGQPGYLNGTLITGSDKCSGWSYYAAGAAGTQTCQ